MQLPFDGAVRRRIHLMRHAEAAYRGDGGDGDVAPEPGQVPLTARGREQASAMRDALAEIEFDYALCSPLPRTRETAEIVLGSRTLPITVEPRFEEVRPGKSGFDEFTQEDLAYAFQRAAESGASFMGGERFAEFVHRVATAMDDQLAQAEFESALFVCHGGVNRAVLQWVLETGPEVLAIFEQDNACLNIIDIDVDPSTGRIVRRYVRAVNFTPYDPAKGSIGLTTLEASAMGRLGSGH